MHTGWKSRGGGTWCFLPKSLGGVKGFRKNCQGGSPYFGFYCIFINQCFEICLRGVLHLPSPLPPTSPPPPPPPVCIYVNETLFCQETVKVFDKLYGSDVTVPYYTHEDAVARAYLANTLLHGPDSILRWQDRIRINIELKSMSNLDILFFIQLRTRED